MSSTMFNHGDVVRLNSGSPKMTIEGFSANGNLAKLVWFKKDFSVERTNIPTRLLVKEDQ